jgi:hypothetical protein
VVVRAALALALAFPLSAAAMPVSVLHTEYTTDIYTDIDFIEETFQRTTVSADPASDSTHTSGDPPNLPLYFADAAASAGLFDLTVATNSRHATANAISEASITFSPWLTGSALLQVNVDLVFSYYTQGSLRLLDTTLGEEVWNWGWAYRATSSQAMSATRDASLLEGHVYVLDMFTRSNARDDQEFVRMLLTGLEPSSVPEPETILLMLPALAALLFRRRRTT